MSKTKTDTPPTPEQALAAAEQHLRDAEAALSEEQRAQHRRRGELEDLNRKVTAALRAAGRTGERADIAELRLRIAAIEQEQRDSEHVVAGRQDAVRDAQAAIAKALLDHYPALADELDADADGLIAEQRALDQAQAALDARKQAHVDRYAKLQQAVPALYPMTSQSRIHAVTLRPEHRLDQASPYSQAGDLLIRDAWPEWLRDVVRDSRNTTPRIQEFA